ncbi:ribosomal protein S15P/S13E [Rhizobium leguminosarum]|uniref:Ribosomal protein S15P/S13E n=1 Tax=Rhizobium leguminosarum TaxID=384 RepID=A0AAE2SW97_RHILE|nr:MULTISPECIES: hypothetical protein [Rhizobium]MBB4289588.1 ribosomal protein S15P/S13E [Rhizobium leguminosarum]MBB4296232.1 ribosomal protein S15P/S13E [Rhizobium leguminosarum]MBB4308508.1 ribosomal protein S15P/S13E [Rhizobium leguminosarum]MBB4416344.1 ribosomal protein S15P/S13E [Rhizobium leguminosarum]MBB4430689.1 ribosomal protein S15P/S13E [Rhizobium esperanzae]
MTDKGKRARKKLPTNEERVKRLRDYLKAVEEGTATVADWDTFPKTLDGTRDFLLPQVGVFPVTNTNILTRTHPTCGPLVSEIKELLETINKRRPAQEQRTEKPKTTPALTPEEMQERIARREYLAQWSKSRLEAEDAKAMSREIERLRKVEDERDSVVAELKRLRILTEKLTGEARQNETSGPRQDGTGKKPRGKIPHLRLVE